MQPYGEQRGTHIKYMIRSCTCAQKLTYIHQRKGLFGTWRNQLRCSEDEGTFQNVPKGISKCMASCNRVKMDILHESVMCCPHAPLEPNVTNECVGMQVSKRLNGIKWQRFLSQRDSEPLSSPLKTQSLLESNRNQLCNGFLQ